MVEENEETRRPVTVTRQSVVSKKVKIWLAVVLSAIVIVLVIQNRHPVNVKILVWEFPVAGIILLPFVFIVGAIVGAIVGYIMRRKR